MPSPRRWTLLASLLILPVGCSDAALAPDAPGLAEARGGNGNGKGNGGGGGEDPDPAPPVVDELEPWDGVQWTAEHHTLGKGLLDRANVAQGPIGLLLTLPAGAYDGAEIASAERHRYRAIEARMRTPAAPGSISAFFFYEGVRKRNDEIDIEIFNDASREIMFTTWVQGRQTNNVRVPLSFDPSAAYHDYRIEWTSARVGFYVDGTLMTEFTTGVPQDAMYILSNVWWPTWLSGPTLGSPASLGIDRIVY